MKKLVAVMAVMFSVNAMASWTGTGNERIEDARDYMRFANGDYDGVKNLANIGWFGGVVTGLSTMYGKPEYEYAVCYPSDATAGQLTEIAGNYIIENPEKRSNDLGFLVWYSHALAFGFQDAADCWRNIEGAD